MTTWAERASALIERNDLPFDERAQDAWLALINERLDDSGLRGKVWGNMTYACDRCREREIYELEVGVEGPIDWRTDQTFIACAFTAGRCRSCGGSMTHINFRDDVTYPEPQKPFVAHVFRVPRAWPVYPTEGIDDDGNVFAARGSSAFLSLNIGGTVTNHAGIVRA